MDTPANQKLEQGLHRLGHQLIDVLNQANLPVDQTIFCLLQVYVQVCELAGLSKASALELLAGIYEANKGEGKCSTH